MFLNNAMKLGDQNILWLSWHSVPRSQNLSKYLKIPIYEYFNNDNIIKRHLYSSIWTIKFLFKNRPNVIFLHYSFLLLLIVVIYKKLHTKNVIIVADCHNKALRRKIKRYGSIIFEKIKLFSFKNTDITIITNKGMIKDISKYHNNYFILPDKIPEFEVTVNSLKNEKYCVYISSFSIDEPVDEIIEAAKIIGDMIKLYWTGKKSKSFLIEKKIPNNIIFTGYLDYRDYYNLISNADCLLLLTTEDDCLQCGAYEGLNAGVPMVISDNKASREYFEDSAIYTKITSQAISSAIIKAINNKDLIKNNAKLIKEKREKDFKEIIQKLEEKIELLFE